MRRILPAMLLTSLLSGPALASGGNSVMPFALDPYGGAQAAQDAFYGAGNIGVLMGRSPWSRLFAGWRLMHGLPVGVAAGHGLARPCCDADGGDDVTKDWMDARAMIPGVAKLDPITLYREVGDFASVQTCFADAFTTAARTLRDRAAAHSAADPAVRAWLDTQDAVFAACNQNNALPALPADAPAWLVKDRAYQEAAHALYERHFDDAETRFVAIAADADSPWQPLGLYLAARAAVDAALPSKDPAVIARARDRLTALAGPDVLGHSAVAALTGALDFRTAPDARRAALAAELTSPSLPPTAAADFKDARRLGQSPAGQPDFLDWLTVFGRVPDKPGAVWFDHYAVDQPWQTDADALAHARARWTATKDPAWLIAAMQASAAGRDAADLVAAARALPDSDPAWLTASYHRIRLDPGNPADTARELDAILARTDLSTTTRNLFLAEREMTVADQAGFLRVARRTAPCASTVDYSLPPTPDSCLGQLFGMDDYAQPALEGRFGDDALPTIDRLPIDTRMALSEDASLSAPLRLDVALTTWTRAVLAGDDPAADRLARTLAVLLPQVSADWKRFAATPPGADKRFAAWFLLAKLPGAATHLTATDSPTGDYTRPVGSVQDFEGHWPNWVFAPAGAAPVVAAIPAGDVVCAGLCGGGAFAYRAPPYATSGTERAERERGRYAPAAGTPGVTYVWEELLAYVQAHPADPRAPEALHWLVQVSRYGKGNARSSYRAFRLLHTRYAASVWAKQTRYFYD